MPAFLAGSRPERIKHAQTLNTRALAGLDEARNLIALEAEDAFLRWEQASAAAAEAREAADTGDKLADDLRQQFTSGLRVRVEDVVNAQVLASQARSQYHEFLYQEIITLADLELITAGAFCARFVEPAAPRPKAAPKQGTGAEELFPGEKRSGQGGGTPR
jgi:outer membrane protein TolC